jgi:hypothetical protein
LFFAQPARHRGLAGFAQLAVARLARGERAVAVLHALGESDVGVGIDARLLIEPPYALYVPYVAGILGQKEARMRTLYLSVHLGVFLCGLKGLDLGLRKDTEVLCGPLLKTLEP